MRMSLMPTQACQARLAANSSVATRIQPRSNSAFRKALFERGWMRVATLLFAASLAWHAWVGMRDILMDYIKPTWLRLSMEIGVLVVLAGYLGWTIQILWR